MNAEALLNFVGGDWDAPKVDSIPVKNPATGEVIARAPMSGASDVEKAVAAASKA